MMNKMVVANLVHRPIRSLISIVAIALEVTLILLIVGLSYGIMNDNKNRTGRDWRRRNCAAAGIVVSGGHQRSTGFRRRWLMSCAPCRM